jgi:hypothetical protein
MKKRSFYNSSGYNARSANPNSGRFAVEVEDNLYVNDSRFEGEDEDEWDGDEWDDMQDSVTFDKQAIKINNAIRKNGDRIK